MSLPGINRDIRRLQRVGYPIKSFLQLISNDRDTETISLYLSVNSSPAAESFSEKYSFVGPYLDLQEKLEKTHICIHGTVNNDMLEFYRTVSGPLEILRVLSCLSLPEMISLLGRLPENVRVERW